MYSSVMTEPSDQLLLIKLRVDPTPWPDDPPSAALFYQMLGVQLVAWGRFEGHFVSAMLQVAAIVYDIMPITDFPLAWEKRARLWKAAFRASDALVPIRNDALTLMTDIKLAARDRGILAHARWGQFVEANPPALELTRLKFESGSQFVAGNIKLTLATLEELIRIANALNHRLIPISQFLSELRPMSENVQLALRPAEELTTPIPQPKRESTTRVQPDHQKRDRRE